MTTSPITVRLMRDQLHALVSSGWEPHVVVGEDGDWEPGAAASDPWPTHRVPLTRSHSMWRDAAAVFALMRLMKRLQPAVVHVSTPKAAYFGTLAAAAVRIPRRIYLVRGLRYQTLSGVSRRVVVILERLACRLATHVVCVSHSVRAALDADAICPSGKSLVIWNGSSAGVAVPADPDPLSRRRAREHLGLSLDDRVAVFVGRITADKGIPELLAAWKIVEASVPNAKLLVVGPHDEAAWSSGPSDLASRDSVRYVGFSSEVNRYLLAADVLCLPSRREGFPNVVLEAAALGVPAVVSDATGCVDAVVAGQTGRVVALGRIRQLAEAIESYLGDDSQRIAHGRNARRRVAEEFDRERHVREYLSTLSRIALSTHP